MHEFIFGLIFSTTFLLFLLALEYISRRNNFSSELTRRIAHLLSGIFGAAMGLILSPSVFITLAFLFFFVITLSYSKHFFTSIHNVKRKTYGELLLPLGILSAYLLSGIHHSVYLASVLILAIADPTAGIISTLRGVQKNHFLGSLAFYMVSLSIMLVIFRPLHWQALVALLVVTAVEYASPLGTDNLTIPIAASLVLVYVLHL